MPAHGNRLAQQRVDEALHEIRAESTLGTPENTREVSCTISESQLAELASALEALGDDLAGDAEVVSRHHMKLQTLDRAAQVLRKLSTEWQSIRRV